MKTKCLWLLLPFFLCGCSNSGVSSISSKEDFVVPAFKISITDSQGGYQFNVDDLGKELNLNSRYVLKLIADKTTGLILGGQAIGGTGADKRINTLTSALLGRLTIEEFNRNDLTYAPPYSTTIDPLLNAAQLLAKKFKEGK